MSEIRKIKIRRVFWQLNKILSNDQAEMIVLAIVVGCLAGLGGVGFWYLIEGVKDLIFGEADLLARDGALPWYVILFAPAFGGLIVGFIAIFAHEVKGHGVSRIIENMVVRGGRIRKRLIVWGTLSSAISIGSGGSCGKEGPIVQIGSALGSTLSSFLKLDQNKTKTLIGCGAAAGIAGVFNAPIGGSMFALEVILGDFALATFSPIIIAAVASTVVSRALRGDSHELVVPSYHLESAWEFGFYAILGLGVALLAILFIKLLSQTENLTSKIPLKKSLTPILPFLGGLGVGAIGLGFPEVFGPWTYKTIDLAVSGQIFFITALALAGLKILATCLTLGSGGSGGVFAPSLFVGALFGSSFGTFVHSRWPDITAEPGAYAIVGMAALVAGTTQAPLTAIMILFEITDSYSMILPLMLCCIISAVFVRQVNKESIYTEQLAKKGINVHAGRDINILKSLQVRDSMVGEFQTLPETMPFKKLLEMLPDIRHVTSFPVVNKNGELSGILSISDFQSVVFEEGLEDLIIVKEMATKDVITVFPDENLQEALQKLSGKDVANLPVVDPYNPKKVVGMLSRRDIIQAYNKALLQYNF